ncbi:hypothetical protein HDV64DRAFT_266293 [Trichoderma sp. TUCIM 5745]
MSLPTSGPGAQSDFHSQSQPQLGSQSGSQPRPESQSQPQPHAQPQPPAQQPATTSLVPSTAEGKPIPVDDSTVEYRTSALRELNHNFPSHRYAKSTGAQNSTYSEPVIVRSYYPPLPSSRPTSSSRGPAIHGGPISGSGVGAGSQVGRFAEAVAGGLPLPSRLVSGEHGMLSTMVLSFGKKPVNGRVEDEARLPPIDAFSFKSFMDKIEAQGGGLAGDINADLDRIAEICARSRYSLSNQYEVHYTPHGSGASFLNPSAQSNDSQGPTLQVVSAEDEHSVGASSTRRKRRMARRNSRAVGTLETIISSSRSSDEEQASRKKSAAEIAEQVRGRSAQKSSGHSSASSSSSGTLDEHGDLHQEDQTAPKKSSSSLALIDASTRHNGVAVDSPRTSANALVSEPAQPQESTSQLEIRTAASEIAQGQPVVVKETPHHPKWLGHSVAKGAITPIGTDIASGGILSIINGWMPWRPPSPFIHHKGLAEGRLRELLGSKEPKGKGPEILQ